SQDHKAVSGIEAGQAWLAHNPRPADRASRHRSAGVDEDRQVAGKAFADRGGWCDGDEKVATVVAGKAPPVYHAHADFLLRDGPAEYKIAVELHFLPKHHAHSSLAVLD